MPRIDENTSKAIVHVYPSLGSAQSDREEGGTGFVMAIPLKDIGNSVLDHLYVVTNRHLVLGHEKPTVVMRGLDNRLIFIEIEQNSWFRHPDGEDDLAVAPLPGLDSTPYDIAAFPISHCIRADQLVGLNVGIGVDVYYVGRFKADRQAPSITTVRFGNISAMPVAVRHPRFKRDVESYLIETRSRAGFSGSPIVANLRGPVVERGHPRSSIHLGSDAFLLGVSWGHINEWQEARIKGADAELAVQLNVGMLCVCPAWRVIDILNRPELVARREADRKAWLAKS